VSDCKHEYDSYNGGRRCNLCDDRITEADYTEWLEAELQALRAAICVCVREELTTASLMDDYDYDVADTDDIAIARFVALAAEYEPELDKLQEVKGEM